MDTFSVPGCFYQQFDADYTQPVPAEGYGGWQACDLELSVKHTGFVIMHAWATGNREQFPGWYRCVEYLPRAEQIVREVFPALLAAVRQSPLPLFHVVGGGRYYQDYPGYKRALALADAGSRNERGQNTAKADAIPIDRTAKQLRALKSAHGHPGQQNQADVRAGFAAVDFPAAARPQGEEGIAENAEQLWSLCVESGINHLIYVGFAINWCLLMSPGGMLDMHRRGILCSTIRQAVTAVENKESARAEWGKQLALWRVALAFGFVFDCNDIITALTQLD